jgi:hypothetical protein
MQVGALITVGGSGSGARGMPDGTTTWTPFTDQAALAISLGFDYLLVRAAAGISAVNTPMGPAMDGSQFSAEVDGIPQARRDGFGWMADTLDAWAPVTAQIPTIFYTGLPEFAPWQHKSGRAIYEAHYKPFVDVGGVCGIDSLTFIGTRATPQIYSPAWKALAHMRSRLGLPVWVEPLEQARSDVWLRKFGLNVLTIFSNGTLYNDRTVVAYGSDGWLRRSDVIRWGGRCAAIIAGLGATSEIRDAVPLRMQLSRRAARLGHEPILYPWGGIDADDVAELKAYPSNPTAESAGAILAANFTAAEGETPPFDAEDGA